MWISSYRLACSTFILVYSPFFSTLPYSFFISIKRFIFLYPQGWILYFRIAGFVGCWLICWIQLLVRDILKLGRLKITCKLHFWGIWTYSLPLLTILSIRWHHVCPLFYILGEYCIIRKLHGDFTIMSSKHVFFA